MSLLPSSWSRLPTAGDDQPPEVARRRLRLWLTAAGVAVAVLAGAGIWLAPKVTRRLEARSVRQAREFLQQQDYRRAELMLEQAVSDNPADFDARRELAKFFQEADSSRAFAAWRDLVRDDPANDENRLGLAVAGLRLNDLAVAREALAGVSAAGRGQAEYHRIAAGIAYRAGDSPALAAELAELARLQPDDPRAQFNHAAFELASGDPARMDRARHDLAALARGSALRIRATLELVRDATRRGGPTVYTDLANSILPRRTGFPTPAWLSPPRSLFDLIEYMQAQPNPDPDDAAMLVDWVRRQGMAADVLLWLGSLDPATQNNPAVLAARVACLVQIHDWRGVESGLRSGAWGRVPADAISLAFAAHLQSERRHQDHAVETWKDALEVTAKSPDGLRVLLRLAQAFAWRDEAASTLRALTQAVPRDPTAWRALAIDAAAQGATARLADIYADWTLAMPGDPAVRGVRFWVQALLGQVRPGDFTDRPPNSPAYHAALALALRGAGRGDDAAAVLAKLPAEARSDPRVTLMQGLLLSDGGRRDESAKVLAIAASGPLLPEERALVEAARRKNAARD